MPAVRRQPVEVDQVGRRANPSSQRRSQTDTSSRGEQEIGRARTDGRRGSGPSGGPKRRRTSSGSAATSRPSRRATGTASSRPRRSAAATGSATRGGGTGSVVASPARASPTPARAARIPRPGVIVSSSSAVSTAAVVILPPPRPAHVLVGHLVGAAGDSAVVVSVMGVLYASVVADRRPALVHEGACAGRSCASSRRRGRRRRALLSNLLSWMTLSTPAARPPQAGSSHSLTTPTRTAGPTRTCWKVLRRVKCSTYTPVGVWSTSIRSKSTPDGQRSQSRGRPGAPDGREPAGPRRVAHPDARLGGAHRRARYWP